VDELDAEGGKGREGDGGMRASPFASSPGKKHQQATARNQRQASASSPGLAAAGEAR